jgi:hypothetical protein
MNARRKKGLGELLKGFLPEDFILQRICTLWILPSIADLAIYSLVNTVVMQILPAYGICLCVILVPSCQTTYHHARHVVIIDCSKCEKRKYGVVLVP